MEVKCDLCFTTVKRRNDLAKHKKSEMCKKIHNTIETIKQEKDKQINKLQENFNIIQNKLEIQKYDSKMLLTENNKMQNKISTLEIQLKESLNKYEDLRKIIEKVATKSTNTVKNYTHNNYLNYISTEPIKFNEFPKQLKNIINCDTVMYDDDDFHNHIVDNILKDKTGKDKVLCTDINRKNFTYKDEKSGELISDPELERLREQLKKGTDIRKIRRDLLEKLVNEYEENGCVGTDPYKIFSDTIQKLNFGSPFVDHIAKKTYVKSKSNKNNNNENNIEEIDNEMEDELDDIEDDEFDEYKKLKAEFEEEC